MYQVLVERSAEKDLRRIAADARPRIVSAMKALATNPRPPGSLKLSGVDDAWRVRVGDYRILYDITDQIKIVRIHRIRPRGDAYR